MAALHTFDHTLQTTHIWLNELASELGQPDDKQRAYHALRVVLHALRDQLDVDEVAALGAQLPLLIRGIFYEGWEPEHSRRHPRRKHHFLDSIASSYRHEPRIKPESVVRAVFHVLVHHIAHGEIKNVVHVLPDELRELWQ